MSVSEESHMLAFSGFKRLRLLKSEPPGRRDDHETADVDAASPWSTCQYYRWVSEAAAEAEGPAKSTSSDPCGRIEVKSSHFERALVDRLSRKLSQWRTSLSDGDDELDVLSSLNASIARYFLQMYNGHERCKMRHGFWVSCTSEHEAWDFCSRICSSGFWLRGRQPWGTRNRRIYTIDLCERTSSGTPLGCCYSAYGYLCCCCRACQAVCGMLRMEDGEQGPQPRGNGLYNIIANNLGDILTFLEHNSQHKNIEHQLLCASVDAYVSQRRSKEICSRLWDLKEGRLSDPPKYCTRRLKNSDRSNKTSGNDRHDKGTEGDYENQLTHGCDEHVSCESVAEDLLEDCGCFLFLKSANKLFTEQNDDDATVNNRALVVDLLRDYSSMWSAYNMPVYMFCCYEVEEDNVPSSDAMVENFGAPDVHIDGAEYMLGRLQYFEHRVDLTRSLQERNSKRASYLSDRLNVAPGEKRDHLLSYLVSLTSGYGMSCLGTIVRMASCEYLAAISKRGPGARGRDCKIFADIQLTARAFEKAVAIRPPLALSVGLPGLCVLPHNTGQTVGSSSGFPPLRVDNGTISVRQGFDSMVLGEPLLGNLRNFVSSCLSHDESCETPQPFVTIEGPSGCGKTLLSIALSHELRSTLILSSVLDFLRPQVGVSEKLVHSFFSSLSSQFVDVNTTGHPHDSIMLSRDSKSGHSPGNTSSRRSVPRCVVVFEGADSLAETCGYMKSLLYALCTELERFRDLWEWQRSCSVIFVFTCQSLSSIPSRLREACISRHRYSLLGNVSTENEIEECFELYLSGRGTLLDRFRELWPSWRLDATVMALRPCDIALLCRTAAVWSVSGVVPLPSHSAVQRLAESLCTARA
ncbi:proteasome-activating nucleotidase [Babesia ovata]|uniref:Proteasome-activating nucleotidase n=1 Tax=Babesia ovata TaxID=189622 RepID=A0A2H6K6B1_9APIC|nr:proteasome-activating nucleotidase [Babesia ovata]GBE58527.1 proteasome-activating nucleotidase [Babesia ovata]